VSVAIWIIPLTVSVESTGATATGSTYSSLLSVPNVRDCPTSVERDIPNGTSAPLPSKVKLVFTFNKSSTGTETTFVLDKANSIDFVVAL
jgi:hypothetical protein